MSGAGDGATHVAPIDAASGARASIRATSAWSPFKSKIFLTLFVAQLVSNVGTNMQAVGSAWLLGDLGASPAVVAMVQTATYLPVFIVGIPAGVAADLFDRIRVLIVTQVTMMTMAAVMAGFTLAGEITPVLVLTLTFALGAGLAMSMPAWQAIQPDLVPREHFEQGVSLGTMPFSVGRAIGPAIAGLVIASAGAGWVFLLNAMSFIGIIAVLLWWRPSRSGVAPEREPWGAAAIAGVRYGRNSPLVSGVLWRTLAVMLPGAVVSSLLPVVVRDRLDWTSNGYGILLAITGAGAIVGAIIRPWLTVHLGADALMGALCSALTVAIVVQGLATNRILVGAAEGLAGFSMALVTTTLTVAIQEAMPGWVRARGLAIFSIVMTGSIAIGAVVWGVLANFDVRVAHLVAATMMAVGLLARLRWRLVRGYPIDLSMSPYHPPVVALEPEPDEGPVLVSVSYSVPPERMGEFRDLMDVVEGYRRRTGGHDWALYRDLGEPTRFIETFLVASWGDHLRQRRRRTATMAQVLTRLAPFAVDDRGDYWIDAASRTGQTTGTASADRAGPTDAR